MSGDAYQTDPGPFLINGRVSGHAVAYSGDAVKGVLKLGS